MPHLPDSILKNAVTTYLRKGFAVVPNFLTKLEITAFNDECKTFLDKVIDEKRPLTKLKIDFPDKLTAMHAEYVKDYQILFQPNAVDEKNLLKISKYDALSFLGMELHHKFDNFRKVALSYEVKSIFKALGYQQPAIFASTIVQKRSKDKFKFKQHQDAFYEITEPVGTAGTFWIALTDSSVESGCLEYVPESHILYPVKKTILESKDESVNYKELPDSAFEKVPVEAGSMVIHNAMTIHRSAENKKSGFIRRSIGLVFYDKKMAKRKSTNIVHMTRDLMVY
ncbi:hypothetical protein B4U79_16504 [Dinothrombium tinctorium]|uniref:Phytanoyl-CoA dioxygenase n=1 Tax=Dinothrombium tinctorium TaxID=1965070 RepID=A0A3S3RR90_9ACAR|nr:hypothetical protein B4U79_16504 [Dinothrombium tinctorium]